MSTTHCIDRIESVVIINIERYAQFPLYRPLSSLFDQELRFRSTTIGLNPQVVNHMMIEWKHMRYGRQARSNLCLQGIKNASMV